MNVLKPELKWIEGRCYRINDSGMVVAPHQEHDLYENDMNYNDEELEEEEDDTSVIMMDHSRFGINFHVAKPYIGSVIGKKGVTKSRLERDTGTTIKIPKQGAAGDIYVYGPTASSVKAARRRINMIVLSSRMKQRPTHFISIPMNSSEIMLNFHHFKELVLNECPSRGIEESVFIKPEKLHLTLGVMCLMDNEERLTASKLFTEAKEKIVMPILRDYLPLKIRLKGLSYMNDDPNQVNVLYGLVREEGWSGAGVLQKLGEEVMKHFYKAGFINEEHLTLHVTLMNTKYREQDTAEETSPNVKKTRATFDGSEILQRFGDYDFGVMELNEIHLSQRSAVREDGYYQPTCIMAITEV